jgi:hypothetical protein
MDRACTAHWEERNAYRRLVRKLKERTTGKTYT